MSFGCFPGVRMAHFLHCPPHVKEDCFGRLRLHRTHVADQRNLCQHLWLPYCAAIPSNGCLQVPYSGRTEPLHRLTPLSRLDKRLCGRHYNSPVDRFIDRFEDNLGHKASVAACAAACRSRTPIPYI